MSATSQLLFYVNGKRVLEANPDPELTLAVYIRNKLHLKGTKISCDQGHCGSCTVDVARYDAKKKKIIHSAVNACLVPLFSVHGCAVTTVEGIGSVSKGMHPVQERIAKGHGTQCGFCTPGFVMSMYCLLKNNPEPSANELEHALQGNLCRCTGYRPIVESFQSFCDDCKCGAATASGGSRDIGDATFLTVWSSFTPYDRTQDPIFPPELQTNLTLQEQSLRISGYRTTVHQPTNLSDLHKIAAELKTEDFLIRPPIVTTGVQRTSETVVKHLISTGKIPEFRSITHDADGLVIGSSVTFTELIEALQQAYKTTAHSTKGTDIDVTWTECLMFDYFPAFDLAGVLITAGCKLGIITDPSNTVKWTDLGTLTHCSEIQSIIKEGIVAKLKIPHSAKNQYLYTYQQGPRQGLDASILTAAISLTLDHMHDLVNDTKIAFGGVSSHGPVICIESSKKIRSLPWNESFVDAAVAILSQELQHLVQAPPISKGQDYVTLALSIFFTTLSKMQADIEGEKVPYYATPMHTAGLLHLALVQSTKAHAKVLSVDPREALKVPGVVDYISAADIPSGGTNTPGMIMIDVERQDDTVFAQGEVTAIGHVIGAVAAEDYISARRGANLVKVQYQDLPAILTIQEAIDANSYLDSPQFLSRGDALETLENSDFVIEDEIYMNGQEHYYLETQTSLVIPKDAENYEVFCSTQNPEGQQREMCAILGIPLNRVVLKCKRVGGGFGGKLNQANRSLWPAAVAAAKLKRPCLLAMSRTEDMMGTGKRHPTLSRFKLGFTKEGRLTALDTDVYTNCGHTLDQSHWVMDFLIHKMDHCYRLDDYNIRGHLCKTNLPSNTGFRAFGGPQAYGMMEICMEKIAQKLNIDPAIIKERNFAPVGYVNCRGDKIKEQHLNRCWAECQELSKFKLLQQDVATFNKQHRWRKRGISMVPTRWPAGVAKTPFEQGHAFVAAYVDGSVQLSHGGIEMGQGMNTKVLQAACRALELPIEQVTILDMSTEKTPNPVVSGGTQGADVQALAAKNACLKLRQRLEPFIRENPKGEWKDWVKAAFNHRVSLSAEAIGLCLHEDDLPTGGARYFVSGACCTMVEVDILTGAHEILQTDIVMDIGTSLNPAADIGQIEGGFIQGYGLYVLEDLQYSETGQLVSNSAGKYHIPTVTNIPKQFRVATLKGTAAPLNVYSSKNTGEPPFVLGSSVMFAILDAVNSARADEGLPKCVTDVPLTFDRIRHICSDRFTKMASHAAED